MENLESVSEQGSVTGEDRPPHITRDKEQEQEGQDEEEEQDKKVEDQKDPEEADIKTENGEYKLALSY